MKNNVVAALLSGNFNKSHGEEAIELEEERTAPRWHHSNIFMR
jgi:hypothetical protein